MTTAVTEASERPPLVSGRSRRLLSTASLLVLALAWASLMQQPGPNQNAHLATVTALSRGESNIDRYRNWTRDTSYVDGHYYAAKAPGLDLLTLPWYLVLDKSGLLVEGSPASVPWPEAESHMPLAAPWQVGLFGATLPAFILLLLVRSVVERFTPGYGTAAAIVVGAGSIVGLLASMYFSHALSACLGFAAFAVLVRERGSPPDSRLVAAAGLLAGLAVTVEFPVGIVGTALFVYALLRTPRLTGRSPTSRGAIAGVLPLLAFNTLGVRVAVLARLRQRRHRAGRHRARRDRRQLVRLLRRRRAEPVLGRGATAVGQGRRRAEPDLDPRLRRALADVAPGRHAPKRCSSARSRPRFSSTTRGTTCPSAASTAAPGSSCRCSRSSRCRSPRSSASGR